MTEWNIQGRGRTCEACGKTFADKEAYHTLLFDERRDWRRCDVCQECWDKQYKDARDRKGFVSHWQGIFEAPAPPTEAIRKESAESLLRKLIEINDPRYMPAGFILAVMLERKRLLKVKEQIVRDGGRVFVYEQPGTGDLFTIADPALQLNQLEAVQRDVAELLEHGIPQPAPPSEAQAPTSESQAADPADSDPDASEPPAPLAEEQENSRDATKEEKEP